MLLTHCLKTANGSKTKPQKYWKKLSDDLEELHSFRNKLAHQPTAENRVIEDDEGTVLIWAKEVIIPNKLDKKKSFKPIEQADLDAHLLSVSAICRKLEVDLRKFPGWEEIALRSGGNSDDNMVGSNHQDRVLDGRPGPSQSALSHLGRRGSFVASRRLAKALNSLNPSLPRGQVVNSKPVDVTTPLSDLAIFAAVADARGFTRAAAKSQRLCAPGLRSGGFRKCRFASRERLGCN